MLFLYRCRHWFIALILSAQFYLFGLTKAALEWSSVWSENRTKILYLVGINTVITTVNEAVSRRIITEFWKECPVNNNFVVKDQNRYRLHRQSIVNILMTMFVTILGGAVIFYISWVSRWTFFVGLSLAASIISQLLTAWLISSEKSVELERLVFDLIYASTLKYFIFEIGRPALINSLSRLRSSLFLTPLLRYTQDLVLAVLKVICFSLLDLEE